MEKKHQKRLFKRFIQWTIEEKIALTLTTILFTIYAASLIYPFIWALINSFKTEEQYLLDSFSLPDTFFWKNYLIAMGLTFKSTTIVGMFFNSIWQTLMATVVGTASCSLMAYVIARYRFTGRNFLYALAIFSMTVPIIGNTPAMYKFLYSTGIADNPLLIWLIWGGGFGFAFLVLYSFFKTISWSYAEAAFIDGAGHFKVFLKVMLPQALPAVVSMIIVSAIGYWNDYMTAYLYLPSYPNIAVGLYELQSQVRFVFGGQTAYYALLLISLLPVLLIYIIFQKKIMTNVTAGGLKG